MKKIILIAILSSSMVISSCTHYYYAPNGTNVPMFRERGEARLNIGANTADEINGTEVQAAYTPVNHFGLMLNYINVHGGDAGDQPVNFGKGHQAEGGAGYYLPMNKAVFELYAGFGGGNVYNKYDSFYTSSVNFSKFFLQPAIGYTTDYFDAIFSMRLAVLSTSLKQTDYPLNNGSDNAGDLVYLSTNRKFLLYEPGITLRAGWKFIKVQTQWNISLNASGSRLRQEKSTFNIGVYLSLAPRWLK